ncbi:MAG: ABC transporter substrate-binding protein [Patescibacteria group bacterium]
MKKVIIWLVIILAIIFIVVFASKNKTENSDVKSGEVIKIGIAIPLTGNYASIGENIKRGFDLAKKDLESGKKDLAINLVYEDACLPKDITSAVQKLINIDKVKTINQFCAIGLVPSIAITEPNKIISMGVAANVDDLLGKNYYFSTNFLVRDNAKTIADFTVNNLKAKKAAFIYYNTQFGKDYRKYIGARFTELGGQVVADEMTSLDTNDFRTNLTKIKAAKPDVIFVTQLTGALGTIIKQTKELDIQTPLVGNYQNEDPVVLSVAGKTAEGFIISSADPAILGDDSNGFRDHFKQLYGVFPDVFASNAYDALHLEVAAYLVCGEDVECIKTELHKIKYYHGVSGNISIDENGVASKPTLFKIVKDGQFVKLEN